MHSALEARTHRPLLCSLAPPARFQRPILLKGHTRPLTMVKYNREGDLLFTCAKDNKPNVWWVENGERLGTFNGHQGSVYNCDINFNTTRLLTGSSDRDCKLWDIVRRHTGAHAARCSARGRNAELPRFCCAAADRVHLSRVLCHVFLCTLLLSSRLVAAAVAAATVLPRCSPARAENRQGAVLVGPQEWCARLSVRARRTHVSLGAGQHFLADAHHLHLQLGGGSQGSYEDTAAARDNGPTDRALRCEIDFGRSPHLCLLVLLCRRRRRRNL